MQIKVEGGELDVGLDDFVDPPDIKRERGFARHAGTALAAQLSAEAADSAESTYSNLQ